MKKQKTKVESLFIFIWVLFILIACQNKPQNLSIPNSDKENTNKKKVNEISWNNPALFPSGASIGNHLRAYYLIGDFSEMKNFLISDNNSIQISLERLSQLNWGYEIQLTNIQWIDDVFFTATYRTNINNTISIEQYRGVVVNDTAKLIVDPLSEKMFINYDGKPKEK